MGFLKDIKAQYDASELKPLDISHLKPPEGWSTIYYGPLTLNQADQIDNEVKDWRKIARHFQVRAKDADGNHLVKPDQFDQLLTLDAAFIGQIVVMMQDGVMSEAEQEKE